MCKRSNKFHEEKYQDKLSFTDKNQHATSSTNKINFARGKNQCTCLTKRKINMQQVSRRRNKKKYNKFFEDINQDMLRYLKK